MEKAEQETAFIVLVSTFDQILSLVNPQDTQSTFPRGCQVTLVAFLGEEKV